MTPEVRRIAVICAALVLLFGVYQCARNRPSARIRRHLKAMAEAASFSGTGKNLETLARTRELSAFFTPDVYFKSPVLPYNVQTRGDLERAWLALHDMLTEFTITVRVNDIYKEKSKRWAADISARADLARGSERDTESRDFIVRWRREKGRWRAESVEQVDAITR